MEMMSPLDASPPHVEDAVTHMHIGSVGIFEGPAPGPGEVQSAVAARLPQVPRYRQKVRFVPLALGRPAWVDDPHFNLDTTCGARHFRRPVATTNCATWSDGLCPSSWIAQSRSGRSGSRRDSTPAAGR